MIRKRLFVVLVCLFAMTAARAMAQEVPPPPPPPPPWNYISLPAKATIVFSEFDGDKKISSLPYVMNMRMERRIGRNNQLRMGIRVPIEMKGKERDRKSTRLNSSHIQKSRMPSSA